MCVLLRLLVIVLAVPSTATLADSLAERKHEPPQIRDSWSRGIVSFVIVDKVDPAHIIFTGLPPDIPTAQMEQIRDAVATLPTSSIVTWTEFMSNLESYALTTVVRNDYPEISILDGIACLIETLPTAPWGLTWNNGIAMSRLDYDYATSAYEQYTKNPEWRAVVDRNRPTIWLSSLGCL
jgi:hypothetical protein